MSKDHPRDQSERDKPLPHCLALLLCGKVTLSQITGAVTLHNLIEGFPLRVFPGRSSPFTIYLQTYDGIGRYSLDVEIIDLTNDSTVAAANLADLDFPERLSKIEMSMPIVSVPLPMPGRYELVVSVDGQPMARQNFDAEFDDGQE